MRRSLVNFTIRNCGRFTNKQSVYTWLISQAYSARAKASATSSTCTYVRPDQHHPEKKSLLRRLRMRSICWNKGQLLCQNIRQREPTRLPAGNRTADHMSSKLMTGYSQLPIRTTGQRSTGSGSTQPYGTWRIGQPSGAVHRVL